MMMEAQKKMMKARKKMMMEARKKMVFVASSTRTEAAFTSTAHACLYSNEGGWKFVDRTGVENLGKLAATYQAAWADIDNDGDLDLCTAGKLFINDAERGNWIRLSMSGDGKVVNRSAIGAIVKIKIGDQVLTRHVESGMGEGNQNEVTLHFGLGDQAAKVSADILWPGAHVQHVKGLAPNRLHRIGFMRQ